ncbi:MAG: D-alanyl-D-alanine carboxypeptidase family protein, partial [Candidatus Eiseniibacteriota bacterium]
AGPDGIQAAKAPATGTQKRRVRRRSGRRAPPGGVVWARNAIVLDPATGAVLYEKNAGTSAPCASLTKLMTALVFLEQRPDFTRTVGVTDSELRGGGHTQLRRGEQVRLGDLLHMSLMCSDNVATRVLVRESGLPNEDFLARMNRKAVELGLARTRFVESTGLDERNVSTAADMARLLRAASENPIIHEISTRRGYDFIGLSSRNRARAHHISNTNRLLYGRYEIRAGKTGFISESGYCLATWIRTDQRDMIAVVMGAPTNATRFADVVRLVQHTTPKSIAPTGL